MNDTNNNPVTTTTTTAVPWQTKVKYIGAGIFIGVVVGPLLRRVLAKIQPKIDEVFESMTGKTEGYAEKASDILYKAKEQMRHADHHHEKTWTRAPKSTIKDDNGEESSAKN